MQKHVCQGQLLAGLDGVQGQVYPRCEGEGSTLPTHCQVIVYHVSQRTLTLSRSSAIPQGVVTCISHAEAFVTGIKIEPRDQSHFWGPILVGRGDL